MTLHGASALPANIELTRITALDVAFSEEDRLAIAHGERPDSTCAALELEQLGARMPALARLRLSGCSSAEIALALTSAGSRLRVLELAGATVDTKLLSALAGLDVLEVLTLTRVVLDPQSPRVPNKSMRSLRRLALRELERDSALGELLAHAPHLREAELVGPWAGHRSMESLAKAKQLTSLTLIDTRVGNFSLNKVKGLERLARVDLRGSTFNNNSPLYLRELPIESFTCACPGFGDAGLSNLRRIKGLRTLHLLQSATTGAGLAALEIMPTLVDVLIHGQDPGPEGFAALANQPMLEALELETETLRDPSLKHLGRLVGLRRLTIQCPEFADRAAAQLATLARLERLDLGGSSISDRGLEHLGKLTALTHLTLHHTRVTNRGLKHLAGLERLRALELDHTDVVDAGVEHLAGLTQLRTLRLDDTLITDAALPHLTRLENLERLNIANTVVTAKGARVLANLPSLQAVNLAGTRAQPRAPERP